MAKFPNRGEYGRNSGIAFSNLKEHFDYNAWRISRTREVENEAEFGKDWSLSLSNPTGDVLSEECTVQSKVITSNSKLKKDYVCDDLETSTINYLRGLPELVLLHFYDAKIQQGYVRWLDEWLTSDDCPKNWQSQKSVRVKIPRILALGEARVRDITLRLLKDGQVRDLERLARSISEKYGRAYDIGVHNASSQNPILIVDPKQESHFPQIHISPEHQFELIRKLAITGEPQNLTHQFSISNLPSELVDSAREWVRVAIFLRDDLLNPELHLKIEFLDESGSTILKHPVIAFKRPTQGIPAVIYGTSYEGYRYAIEMDGNRGKFHVGVDSHTRIPTLERILRLYELNLKLLNAKQLRVTHLETDNVVIDSPYQLNPPWTEAEYIETIIRLTRALIIIRDITANELTIPATFTLEDIVFAETIAKIIQSGQYHGLLNTKLSEDTVLLIDMTELELENFSQFIQEQKGNIAIPTSSYTAKLFDKEIVLGPTTTEFTDFTIIKVEPLERQNAQGEKLVRAIAGFNINEVNMKFDEFSAEKLPD